MKEKINLRLSILVLMIVLAVFSRIIPHIPNFSLYVVGITFLKGILFGTFVLAQKQFPVLRLSNVR